MNAEELKKYVKRLSDMIAVTKVEYGHNDEELNRRLTILMNSMDAFANYIQKCVDEPTDPFDESGGSEDV